MVEPDDMTRFEIFMAITGLTAAFGYMWWLIFRELRHREVITKIGKDLRRPSEVFELHRHDAKATWLLFRISQRDHFDKFLTPEERQEAERLIKAFYEDRRSFE